MHFSIQMFQKFDRLKQPQIPGKTGVTKKYLKN